MVDVYASCYIYWSRTLCVFYTLFVVSFARNYVLSKIKFCHKLSFVRIRVMAEFLQNGRELHRLRFKYTRVNFQVYRSELARRGVLEHELLQEVHFADKFSRAELARQRADNMKITENGFVVLFLSKHESGIKD